jgi:hypothetical protein
VTIQPNQGKLVFFFVAKIHQNEKKKKGGLVKAVSSFLLSHGDGTSHTIMKLVMSNRGVAIHIVSIVCFRHIFLLNHICFW